jgi:hypothetical protein
MKTEDITKVLETIQPDIDKIEDPVAKKVVSVLLNLIEELASDNARLRQENQVLNDEINRLKGEQGKPEIKANIRKDGNISSEQERRSAEQLDTNELNKEGFKLDKGSLEKLKEQRLPVELLDQLESLNSKKYSSEKEFLNDLESVIGKDLTEKYKSLLIKYARYKKRNRSAKLPDIKIDREQKCSLDTTQLPQDAEFKGYEEKVVQDLLIKTDNVKFKRELYYSSSHKKTYIADVPKGYEGDYGPHINSHIVSMKYVNNMSIPKIEEFLKNFGIIISRSYISERLTKEVHMDVFHREKSEMYRSSLQVSSYQQIDDTGSRVDGQNYYTHIVCNPLCTAFFTTERKDRLTVLDILRNFESRSFQFNEETFVLLEQLKVPKKLIQVLQEVVVPEQELTEDEMESLLEKVFPDPSTGKQHRTRIIEAAAIASYHNETGMPLVKVLVSDDAPQFKLLTDEHSLCWIHDGRHYKRLKPFVPKHQEELAAFRSQYWNYYRKLFTYKHNPTVETAELLSAEFDVLFSTKTGYDELDERIARSKGKKEELLTVLKHPEIPLHNNLSENGARVQKRREDVSLHTKSKEGTRAKDTMMSIVETCKKLGISAYRFIFDRVSKTFELPSLAELIRAKANPQLIYNDTS